ncbi:MAG: sigma-54-dependent transcriptional regulator [Roseibacillus sp.]
MTLVLIWVDDAATAGSLTSALVGGGYEVVETADLEGALVKMETSAVDAVILGLDLAGLRRLQGDFPMVPALVVGQAEGSSEAIALVQAGAFDFLPLPFEGEELLDLVGEAVASASDEVGFEVGVKEGAAGELVGGSRAMGKVYRDVAKLAVTPVTALVRGETGTGKELVARALWKHGHRAHRPLVVVNCAAIPENLLESELFGYEKGAFTGATVARKGKFEQANGGTLFLDEIGDMSLPLQAKMLRVLQEKQIERVGGRGEIAIDVRIIAATHQPLEKMVEEGSFREDLFYRLQATSLVLPPLRDRLGDVELLTRHFLAQLSEEVGVDGKISKEAISHLARQSWPGNVRQLQNVLRRSLLKRRELVIGRDDVEEFLVAGGLASPESERTLQEFAREALDEAEQVGEGKAFRDVLREAEKTVIKAALERSGGNQSKAARWLGITRLTLREKLKGIHVKQSSGL